MDQLGRDMIGWVRDKRRYMVGKVLVGRTSVMEHCGWQGIWSGGCGVSAVTCCDTEDNGKWLQ
jgi:hypothetical protein